MRNTINKAALVFAPFAFTLGLTSACGTSTSSRSDVKVTNGVVVKDTVFPSTILLVLQTPEGEGLCTGTFVNDSQVVTAGHCVEGLDASDPSIFYATHVDNQPTAVAQAVSFKRNPRYSIEAGVSPYDLAVINFPQGTAPAVSAIASATPDVDTNFTIVGYGNNANFNDDSGVLSGSGAGIKRHGTNTIQSIEDGMLVFGGLTGKEGSSAAARGKYVASGEGDSGGPLFVDGELAGVTSGGGLSKAEDGVTDVAISLYVDLNSDVSQAFLKTALK